MLESAPLNNVSLHSGDTVCAFLLTIIKNISAVVALRRPLYSQPDALNANALNVVARLKMSIMAFSNIGATRLSLPASVLAIMARRRRWRWRGKKLWNRQNSGRLARRIALSARRARAALRRRAGISARRSLPPVLVACNIAVSMGFGRPARRNKTCAPHAAARPARDEITYAFILSASRISRRLRTCATAARDITDHIW